MFSSSQTCRRLAVLCFWTFATIALGQTPPEDGQDAAQSSTLEVKPGPPALKQKDIWNENGRRTAREYVGAVGVAAISDRFFGAPCRFSARRSVLGGATRPSGVTLGKTR
jgi:hypothetical protein